MQTNIYLLIKSKCQIVLISRAQSVKVTSNEIILKSISLVKCFSY